MAQKQYDVLVVGAGPAGLSAARTLARLGFQTLVIDRAAGPEDLGHVSDAIVVPASGLVSAELAPGGLYLPQIDLLVPESLVAAREAGERLVAPGGEVFDMPQGPSETPAALLDQAGLLRLHARQAAGAGAEFLWDTSAAGLLFDGQRVAGVRTTAGDVEAALVISAEGAARSLCEQAGLHAPATSSGPYLLVVTQQVAAPHVGQRHLGRIITLGRSYTTAPAGFGTLVMPGPGRATMTFTIVANDISCDMVASAWRYLAEYAHDPRVAGLLAGARVLERASFLIPVREPPASVVSDGFMGLGDAVTPAGHLGILPAMYLGRQAALIAAGAVEEGDTGAAALAPYDDFYRSLVLPRLAAEAGSLLALMAMSDDEVDRLCCALGALHLPLPFLQSSSQLAADTLDWLVRQAGMAHEDLQMIARVFGVPGLAVPVSPEVWSATGIAAPWPRRVAAAPLP